MKTICTDDSITVYWDCEKIPYTYHIFLNDVEQVTTRTTHATIRSLTAETAYRVSVTAEYDGEIKELFNESLVTEASKRRLDVTAYGAVGDGKTLCTKILQKAFDDCGRGDCVYFPPGVYLSGALFLHGDTEVYLEEGAVLQGTAEPKDYLPKIHQSFEGNELDTYAALLNVGVMDSAAGITCENVTFRGGGTVRGGGRLLADRTVEAERESKKEWLETLPPEDKAFFSHRKSLGRVRSKLILCNNTKNILMDNIKIQNAACWNVHLLYCKDVVTHDCDFNSHGVWNGDGWNPESSEDCTIFGCTFDTGDDCVAIKSGKNPDGNRINRPSKNIRVFDCKAMGGHGVAIGSEMSGGVDGVWIWDCDMEYVATGISIKATKKRGGYVRNVYARNMTVAGLSVQSVNFNDDGEGAPEMPRLENFSFEDITITGINFYPDGRVQTKMPIRLNGFDDGEHAIRGVRLKNIHILLKPEWGPYMEVKHCSDVSVENVSGVPENVAQ